MWFGDHCEINVCEHRVYIKEDAKPFKPQPFRGGPTTGQLEKAEVETQLKA